MKKAKKFTENSRGLVRILDTIIRREQIYGGIRVIMAHIFVVASNLTTLYKVQEGLRQSRYQVTAMLDDGDVLLAIRQNPPNLVILSLDLPQSNSLMLLHDIRRLPHLTNVPILLLTQDAKTVVSALDMGADDVVLEPFVISELLARVRVLLRYVERLQMSPYQITLNVAQRRAWLNGSEVELTPVEYDLLVYLAEEPDIYRTPHDLLHAVWQYPKGTGDTALVRNHIHNLRSKLETSPEHPQIIVSSHGRGYRIQAQIRHALPA